MAGELKVNFQENLKAHRRTMKPGNRLRTQDPTSKSWLYPFADEKVYLKKIKKVLDPLVEASEAYIRNRIMLW